METDVQEVGGPQREWLAHIDFRLHFLGEMSRTDISSRFEVAPVVATKVLSHYRTLAPNNIRFDGSSKTYRATDDFSPDRALSALPRGLGNGQEGIASGPVPCEYPDLIYRSATEVVAAITPAIARRRVLSVSYVSSSSRQTERKIVPPALANNGLCRHFRACDPRASSFCNFALTRFRGVSVLSSENPLLGESVDHDVQWSRKVEMEVVTHPDFPYPELAALDYLMTDVLLQIRAKAALAGYVLRRWSVDCSEAHPLRGPIYRHWLWNRRLLKSVVSASIAPGYLSEESDRG